MHGYYNPALGPEDVEALDQENWITLQTVQAFLGLVSANFVAIAVEVTDTDAAAVHVGLRKHVVADVEAVDDALFDLDVLLEGAIRVAPSIVVADALPDEWKWAPFRLVFAARPDVAEASDISA